MPVATDPQKIPALRRRPGCQPARLPVALVAACVLFQAAHAEPPPPLVARDETGQARRVRIQLDARGTLKIPSASDSERTVPIEASGTVCYDEVVLASSHDPWLKRALRNYAEASARLRIDTAELRPELSLDNRSCVARVGAKGRLTYAIPGTLGLDEVELVEVPGDSLLLSYLLPPHPVQHPEGWQPALEPVGMLFGLDAATGGQVTCRVQSSDSAQAVLAIEGSLQGRAAGSEAEVQLTATARYDFAQQSITRFTANFREQRAAGLAGPGLDVTSQLEVTVSPAEASGTLRTPHPAAAALEERPEHRLVAYSAKRSDIRFLLDRDWMTVLDRHDLCVFRLLDGGELIAQCNISELPPQGTGPLLSLEAFETEVRRTLGDQLGAIQEASQRTTAAGNRVLRIVATGGPAESPAVWIQHYITGASGRNAAIAFTLEASQLERFTGQDRAIIDSFEFLPRRAEPAASP